jgi:hypothetical protein
MAFMDDLLKLFQESLKEEGLDADVTHMHDPARQADVIEVTKEINGEDVSRSLMFTAEDLQLSNDKKQYIAMRAGELARWFNDYATERVVWGKKAVLLDMKDGYSAMCFTCGAEVDEDDFSKQSPMLSETAVPQPVSGGLDRVPEAVIKMGLQALLRDECDPMCENSPGDGVYRKI